MSTWGRTTKVRRVRPSCHLRWGNARPHVTCNAWFGDTMPRHPQSETAAVRSHSASVTPLLTFR